MGLYSPGNRVFYRVPKTIEFERHVFCSAGLTKSCVVAYFQKNPQDPKLRPQRLGPQKPGI